VPPGVKEALRPEVQPRNMSPRPRQLRGQSVVCGQELPTLYAPTKFEQRRFIRLRNIAGVLTFDR